MPGRIPVVVALILMLLGGVWASAARAQPVTIRGRVLESGNNTPIVGAAVTFGAAPRVLTGIDGTFRLPAGRTQDTLTVVAFGYRTLRVGVDLRADTAITMRMELDPVALDSLLVRARYVNVGVRLTDGTTDRPVTGEAVYATHGRSKRTNLDGRLKFDRVPTGSLLLIDVRAFAYEPVSQLLEVSEGDTTVHIALVPDTAVTRRIAEEAARLQKRSNSLPSWSRIIEREDLLRMVPYTAAEAVKLYAREGLSATCFTIDEARIHVEPGLIGAASWLEAYMPEEIERIEVLRGGAVLRVYTRRFIERMVRGEVTLQPLTYIRGMYGPAICT
jgi:hypothetical protein